MGVFGAFFGCRGDAGFKASLLGVSSGVGGFNVAMLLRLVREKFALRGLMVGVSAKKFALHAQNTQNSAFLRLLGEFFSCQPVLRLSWMQRGALQAGCGGGFALHEALLRRVVGVSEPHVVQFPRGVMPGRF